MAPHSKSRIGYSYHSISDSFQLGINRVPRKKFNSHISYISTKSDAFLSFDDGYESFYTNALDTIIKAGLSAIVFPVTGSIGNYNSWDVNFLINSERHMDERQLADAYSRGVKIGSHGHRHRSFIYMSESELVNELKVSKRILEDIVSEEIDSLSPPFGHIDLRVLNHAYEAGYRKIYSHNDISIPKDLEKLEIIQTMPITRLDSVSALKRKFSGSFYERFKGNFISSFSNLSVIVKEIL